MKTKHLFLMTILSLMAVFFIGVFVGRATVSTNIDEITSLIKNNELNTESYLIEQELIGQFEQSNCDIANSRIEELSTELWIIGKKLSADDTKQKLSAENFNFLKRKYHLMQIRAYLLFKKLSDICSSQNHMILFYFSRSESDSQRQGIILDRAVENHDVTVLAIEYNYSKELRFLEDYYRISTTPSIIVDYEKRFTGFTDYEEIEPLIE